MVCDPREQNQFKSISHIKHTSPQTIKRLGRRSFRHEKPRDHKTRLRSRAAYRGQLWENGLRHSGRTGGITERLRVGERTSAAEVCRTHASRLPRGHGQHRPLSHPLHHRSRPPGTLQYYRRGTWYRHRPRHRRSPSQPAQTLSTVNYPLPTGIGCRRPQYSRIAQGVAADDSRSHHYASCKGIRTTIWFRRPCRSGETIQDYRRQESPPHTHLLS